MKLLYLVGVGLPTEWAHGVQIMHMCEALAAVGNEVELVIPKRRNELEVDPFDYYKVKNNFKIVKLPCLDIYPNKVSKLFFWIRQLSFLLVAKLYLAINKVDRLYTRSYIASYFLKNFIFELHTLPENIRSKHIRSWVRAKGIIVLTDLTKQKLISVGVPAEKILVAPDAVSLRDFQIKKSREECREILHLPKDKKIVLYAGSLFLHEWKGVDVFLQSANSVPNYLLVVVGGTEKELDSVKKVYNSPNILFVGRKEHREVAKYLKAADVLILPNKKGEKISEFYTSPLKMFEYMASGTPIVASDLPSIREVLNEENAILVRPNDPFCLANGIKQAIDCAELTKQRSCRALCDVSHKSWEQRAENIGAFLERL